MPRSRDVSVILTLCEYGDYLYTDIQTARESQSSDDCAVIIKMLGSVRPWSFALEKYMREIGALFEWSFDRRQHGPRPATPMYDSLKMEAESRGMGRKELTDRIKAYVERRNQYCDNSIQNLIMSKSWKFWPRCYTPTWRRRVNIMKAQRRKQYKWYIVRYIGSRMSGSIISDQYQHDRELAD